jgi:hypothetical protein
MLIPRRPNPPLTNNIRLNIHPIILKLLKRASQLLIKARYIIKFKSKEKSNPNNE